MTTASNEAVPAMPDVRAAQREARRITAILEWPTHLIAAVCITVVTGLWFGGRYAGKGTGVIMLIFLSCFIGAALFRKRVVRAFLGAQTPMIVRKRSYGPEDLLFIAGLVVGAVMGFASTKLRDTQGEGVIWFSCVLGGGIPATFYAWARTRLWEFIMSLALQIVMLGVLQTFHALDSRAIWIFLPFAIFHSCLFAISFFIRWRKWVKSLPETVKSEEAQPMHSPEDIGGKRMTTVSNEAVPVMPDVRAVQREARRVMVISHWPQQCILAFLMSLWLVMEMAGFNQGKTSGVMGIVFGLSIIAMSIFAKTIRRTFLGAKVPMINAPGDSGPFAAATRTKIKWMTGMLVGGIIGFGVAWLCSKPGGDSFFVYGVSVFVCWAVGLSLYQWNRTRLWEFILAAFLLLCMLPAWLFLDSSLVQNRVSLSCAALLSLVLAISFCLRWRKWVKSLPETMKAEEA